MYFFAVCYLALERTGNNFFKLPQPARTSLPDLLSNLSNDLKRGEVHVSDLGSIHLGIAAEDSEVAVHERGIEHGRNSKHLVYAEFALGVEDVVQVILDADPFRAKFRAEQACRRQPAFLLLRTEAFQQDVILRFNQQFSLARRFGIDDVDRMLFFRNRPFCGQRLDVVRHQQRHRSLAILLSEKKLCCPKGNHRTSRDPQAGLLEALRQGFDHLHNLAVVLRDRYLQQFLTT